MSFKNSHTIKSRSYNFWCEMSVVTYELNELLATKFKALYQRRKGRDLFDLGYILKHHRSQIEPKEMILIFKHYCQLDKVYISRKDFESNLQNKLADLTFGSDIQPLLNPAIDWDFKQAVSQINEELIALLD